MDAEVRYRVSFVSEHGRILEFVVQLGVAVAGEWKPAVRFDTVHGFAHGDRYEPGGTVKRHEILAVSDFNEALTLAIHTIRNDWEDLIRAFREKIP